MDKQVSFSNSIEFTFNILLSLQKTSSFNIFTWSTWVAVNPEKDATTACKSLNAVFIYKKKISKFIPVLLNKNTL